ncbi:hypothetical protein Q3G72_003720 [Acer saccharum]|nr:hypothetical protein Q3G72_003720 [Acer saccharum]
MADNSPKTPIGVIDNVYLDVHRLKVLVEFVVLDVKENESYERDRKLLLGRSFIATAGMIIVVLSRDIFFSYGGKSVRFKVDLPKDSQEDGCLVLDVPKSRKKKNRVFDLMQAFEMVTKMEEGNHDCLIEQEEIKLQYEDLAKRMLEEIFFSKLSHFSCANVKENYEFRKASKTRFREKVEEVNSSSTGAPLCPKHRF